MSIELILDDDQVVALLKLTAHRVETKNKAIMCKSERLLHADGMSGIYNQLSIAVKQADREDLTDVP